MGGAASQQVVTPAKARGPTAEDTEDVDKKNAPSWYLTAGFVLVR